MLLSDDAVRNQFLNPQLHDSDSTLNDYRDGEIFRSNLLFNSTTLSIQLILYQDAFEVTNPLGSAKSSHKLFAMYYSLGNLYSYSRSCINPIQLVLLCKEKFLNAGNLEVFFQPLLRDLLSLETDGIDIGLGHNIRGSVFALTGDNLGSHWVGGFVTNFSSSVGYSCRYCSAQNLDCTTTRRVAKPLRTTTSYHAAVTVVQTSDAFHFEGIKFSSPFNQLRYYHVCKPGLPPCVAHDIFEGIAKYDLMLCVQYFIRNKWFSESYLNDAILNFPYDPISNKSKCIAINKHASKISGNASQIWCFLRFFPLFVLNKVKDFNDSAGRMIILLRSLVEIVCAPKITHLQISLLSEYIDEYLDLRSSTFFQVRLRPKHHYLTHYPYLILQFGPIIHMWTLRFESKHSYFKNVVDSTGNFVNVSLTLARSHQMLQGYLHKTELLQPKLIPVVDNSSLYSENVAAALAYNGTPTNACTFCKQAQYNGTMYKANQFVVIKKRNFDLILGKIVVAFLFDGKL